MGLLDHLNNITYKKISWENLEDSDKKSFNPYMINRFLSMEIGYIEIVNFFQKYIYNLSNKTIYKLYLNFFPKKRLYNKYISKTKENKYDDRIYEVIQLRYNVSKQRADEYIQLLSKDTLKNMIVKTGHDEKQANKMIKKI